jgi:hypothetical protein
LGGRRRDANVKRSAGIAQPKHDDATDFETQGTPDPGFSAAKGSSDAGHDSKQQSWAEKRNR